MRLKNRQKRQSDFGLGWSGRREVPFPIFHRCILGFLEDMLMCNFSEKTFGNKGDTDSETTENSDFRYITFSFFILTNINKKLLCMQQKTRFFFRVRRGGGGGRVGDRQNLETNT